MICFTVIFVFLKVVTVFSQDIDWTSIQDVNIYVEPSKTTNSASRIIGGTEVTPNSIPYQVALFLKSDRGTAFCGGSLISENYVLTAAHCTEKAKSVTVILGAHNLRQNETTSVKMTCEDIKVHPEWDRDTLKNDISLIKLPEPVTLNEKVSVINLAESGSFSESKALLTGWGKTSDESKTSAVLNQVDLPVLSNEECEDYFETIIKPSHICTSGVKIKGGCNGDSGGPLVVDGQQIGIVSFGSSKCTKGYPTVFTRVTEYKQWIAENSDLSDKY